MLDAPEREFCRVQRSRTNTPMQALLLLNGPTFVEAARKLAERMITEGGDEQRSRLVYGFRLATARIPTRAELDILTSSLDRYQRRFAKDNDAAVQLLSVGEATSPELNQTEFAAYTAVSNILLNLDEFITK